MNLERLLKKKLKKSLIMLCNYIKQQPIKTTCSLPASDKYKKGDSYGKQSKVMEM